MAAVRSRESGCTGKGKCLTTCCSAAYLSTVQRFTILEVAADWHELVVPRRIMQPSTARDSKQLDPRYSTTDILPPTISRTRPSPRSP